jgi:ABC-type transporter Mla subunit MlaD
MKLDPQRSARWAFGAVILIVALGAVVWYGHKSTAYSRYLLRTHEVVSGLIADAPVELHGVEVGTVQRVDLLDPRTVEVMLKIRKDVPITSATVATITARGLAARGFTGYVYVALEDDGTDPRPLPVAANDGVPMIRSAPSRSVDMDTAVSQVTQDVRAMSVLLRSLLDEHMVTALKNSADDLQRVARTLAANSDRLGAIMANTERATGMLDEKTIRALQQWAADLHTVTRTLASNNERLATIIVNADHATSQLQPILQSGHEAIDSLQTQVLPEAYNALWRLEQLSSILNKTATRIDRDPSVLLHGKARPAPGPGEAQ